MYLSVFIYSVEGVGPRNVRPIKTLGPSVNVCICIPLRTLNATTKSLLRVGNSKFYLSPEFPSCGRVSEKACRMYGVILLPNVESAFW